MTSDRRRTVLERLAYGTSSDVRPADRLKALELLQDLDEGRSPGVLSLVVELAGLSGEALEAEVDGIMSRTLALILEPGQADRYPATASVLEAEVELRVKHETDSWRSLEECEQDFEAQVGVDALSGKPITYNRRDQESEPPAASAESPAPVSKAAPPGLDPEDVERGWHRRSPRR